MPAGGIHRIHWGTVTPPARVRGFDQCATVIAVWPSPVNADACFASAGFHEFDDPDDDWETQWKELITRTLQELERLGTPVVKQEAEHYEDDPTAPFHRSALARLLPRTGPLRQVHLPLVDQILAVTGIYDHTEVLVEFGSPPAALLRADSGHAILWIGWTAPNLDANPFLARIAAGHEVAPATLDWSQLLRRSSHTNRESYWPRTRRP